MGRRPIKRIELPEDEFREELKKVSQGYLGAAAIRGCIEYTYIDEDGNEIRLICKESNNITKSTPEQSS